MALKISLSFSLFPVVGYANRCLSLEMLGGRQMVRPITRLEMVHNINKSRTRVLSRFRSKDGEDKLPRFQPLLP